MGDAHTDDIRLLEEIRQGNANAFQTLYRRYANAVYSVALRVTRDPHLAEEVTQDVFMKLWQKHHLYDEKRARFGTWLLSVTRFAAIDRMRYEGRRFQAAKTELEGPTEPEVYVAQVDHDLWEMGQHLRMLIEPLILE